MEHFEAKLTFHVLNNIQYDLIIGKPSIIEDPAKIKPMEIDAGILTRDQLDTKLWKSRQRYKNRF